MWGGWDSLDPKGEGAGWRVGQAKGRAVSHGMFRLDWG